MDAHMMRDSIMIALDSADVPIDEDAIDTVCSEGCQGIESDSKRPGFVVSLRHGRRFHVTVTDLGSDGWRP